MREDSFTERAQFVNSIGDSKLDENGTIVIIEPALLKVARSFHRVRDLLINSDWHIYGPCVSDRKCPMLARDRDWCHQVIDWQRPMVVKQLDELIGNRKETLKFSYLALRRDGKRMSDRFATEGDVYRAVGDLQSEKGKDMIYLCGVSEALPHTLLKRDRTELTKPFIAITRGDLIEITSEQDRNKERLTATDKVTILPN